MRSFTLALLAASAAAPILTLAQQSSTNGCGQQIDNIIFLCLQTTQSQLNACAPSDWSCMCTAQKPVLGCYDNCPTSPARSGAEGSLQSWCEAAKQYDGASSSSSAQGSVAIAAVTASSSSSAGMAASASATMGGTASATMTSGSGSGGAATQTGAAVVGKGVPQVGGGFLAVVLGAAAIL